MVEPAVATAELVNANLAGQVETAREVRHDQREVAALGDHGVSAVDIALSRVAGVGVHVGDNLQTPTAALGPYRVHAGPVEHDVATQGVGVDRVVGDEVFDNASGAVAPAQEEAAAFAMPAATVPEFRENPCPQTPAARQGPRREDQRVNSLH